MGAHEDAASTADDRQLATAGDDHLRDDGLGERGGHRLGGRGRRGPARRLRIGHRERHWRDQGARAVCHLVETHLSHTDAPWRGGAVALQGRERKRARAAAADELAGTWHGGGILGGDRGGHVLMTVEPNVVMGDMSVQTVLTDVRARARAVGVRAVVDTAARRARTVRPLLEGRLRLRVQVASQTHPARRLYRERSIACGLDLRLELDVAQHGEPECQIKVEEGGGGALITRD